MKQLKTILKFEFMNYLKNKVFVVVTILLVVGIGVGLFIPNIVAHVKKDEGPGSVEPGLEPGTEENKQVLVVKADSEEIKNLIVPTFEKTFPNYKIVSEDKTVEDIESGIKSGEIDCAFVFGNSIDSYTYYVNNLSMYDMNTSLANESLQSVYRTVMMAQSGLTQEQIAAIMSVQINNEVKNLGADQINNFFYTYIMIMALYIVIMLYGQMVAMNVATEKSSRAMELLITSADPVSMMFGKVIASCLAGLIQIVAVFGSAIFFYNLNKEYLGNNPIMSSIFNMPVELLVYMIVFFILGFLIYAFLYGAIGSTASKLEDINTSVMPLTFLFIIAFFVVIFSISSGNVDNIVIKICSYIPFTSPMAMFTRIAMSTVPVYEIAISIVILVASVIGVGVLSAKIYRVGVLLYGTKPKISSIIKSIKKA